ncbi:hypothetical protein J6590_061580 [Homalodisca vitripennis]|nr:hypothetical protein J6590_061580 [Homalodisca vitripennis]
MNVKRSLGTGFHYSDIDTDNRHRKRSESCGDVEIDTVPEVDLKADIYPSLGAVFQVRKLSLRLEKEPLSVNEPQLSPL